MPYFSITDESMNLISRMTDRLQWERDGETRWRTRVSNRSYRKLKDQGRPGEKVGDTLVRLIQEDKSDSQSLLKELVRELAIPPKPKPNLWETPLIPEMALPGTTMKQHRKYGFSAGLVSGLGHVAAGHEPLKSEDSEVDSLRLEIAKVFEERGLVLEKPPGTSLHHLVEYSKQDVRSSAFLSQAQSFVVENDWAKPLEKSDLTTGDFTLPYSHCCFEFLVSGVRVVLALQEEADVGIMAVPFYGYKRRWFMGKDLHCVDGRLKWVKDAYDDADGREWAEFFTKHVRAICIMLEAEVAEALERDQIDPGSSLAKSNQKRGKRSPRYHVIRLVGRHTRHRSHGSTEYQGIVPLHFRRGHWRHFRGTGGNELYVDVEGTTRSRTRIKWMLVGNEDLGFIEKHYRL